MGRFLIMLILIATVAAVTFTAVGNMDRIGNLVGHADQNVERLKDGVNGQIDSADTVFTRR